MVETINALYDVSALFRAIAAAFSTETFGRKRILHFGTWYANAQFFESLTLPNNKDPYHWNDINGNMLREDSADIY